VAAPFLFIKDRAGIFPARPKILRIVYEFRRGVAMVLFLRSMIRRRKKGFTLLELLIVLSVLAVLVAIGVPNFKVYLDEARLNRIADDGRLLKDAAYRYYLANGRWPVLGDPLSLDDLPVELYSLDWKPVNKEEPDFLAKVASGEIELYVLDESLLRSYVRVKSGFENYVLRDLTGSVYICGAGLPLALLDPPDHPSEPVVDITGSGTREDPYIIYTLNGLNQVRNNMSAHYRLGADIDASPAAEWNGGKGWEPIGYYNSILDYRYFTGTFDGRGFVISGLCIKRSDCDNVGLFGVIDGAVIKNLELINVDITSGGQYVGGAVGRVDGRNSTVEDVHVTGSINTARPGTLAGDTGGVAGCLDRGSLVGCSFDGEVSASGGRSTGGIVGYVRDDAVITYCNSFGEVRGTGNNVGGVAGSMVDGSLSDCWSAATVTGRDYVGGVVGDAGRLLTGTSVVRAWSSGVIFGEDCVGGVVGRYQDAGISLSYFKGSVFGDTRVGGLVGYFANTLSISVASISDCYSVGSVYGDECVGGLIGAEFNFSLLRPGAVRMSFAAGPVSGNKNVGGFLGYRMELIDSTVQSCYWDKDATGCPSSAGKAQGKTTAQMKSQATFSGWDFGSVWAIDEGVSYPFLMWQFRF